MTSIVEAYLAHARCGEQLPPVLPVGPPVERSTVGLGEHEILALPRGARELALPELGLAMIAKPDDKLHW